MSIQRAGAVNQAGRHSRKRVLLALSQYDYRHHAGVARYAAEHRWALDDFAAQKKSLPASWNGDGIISCHGDELERIEWLASTGVPVVDIGESSTFSQFPRVCCDQSKIAAMAVDHFAARGYKTLAFTWRSECPEHKMRLEGLRAEALMRRMRFLEFPLAKFDQLRLLGAFPLGLIAADDAVALNVLHECEDSSVLVPEQVAILGIDNFESRCNSSSITLSSVDSALEKQGYEAAALLDQLMNGHTPPTEPIRIAPQGIVERDSTDMFAVEDVEVAQALRFIIKNFRAKIGLRDVVAATGISLRRLQTRFKECMGRTILSEINGRRVRFAQKQLEQTTRRIRAIAVEAGFGSAVKMIRVFQQYIGMSPRRYRRQAVVEDPGKPHGDPAAVD